ncbi:hypothetical protein QLL95_gp0353 [Cotonvirus japonicus]|uniref:KilA-N domain-containing protein n=1 Tax=Cotonvirus japonicus TaxID=2811091 RepID=A0ABM7NUB1_9VIRU|nr:hypothetical protein QLL95_gp0353 [Cotonvirus japonicus]BCS83770.1 hypothetical protein [Cotonvirus japonicus]
MPSKTNKNKSNKSNKSEEDYELSDYEERRVIKKSRGKSDKKVRKSNVKPLKKFTSKKNNSKSTNKSKKNESSDSESSDNESSDSESSDNENLNSESSDNESSDSKSENKIISKKKPLNKKEYFKKKKLLKYSLSFEESEFSESEFSEGESKDNKSEDKKPDDYKENDIRNIIIKDIDDNFAEGKLGDFNVIIMKENAYVNATKLCDKSGSKDFYHWKETKKAKELIQELKSSLGKTGEPVILKNMKGNYVTRGTYVHPKLIINIAAWCSAAYALKISDIVIHYHAKEAIEEKEKLLKKKNDKIDKMSNKIDLLLDNNKELLEKNKKMDERIKRLAKKNDKIYNQNQDMLNKISVISNDRVIEGKRDDNHMFIIVKNNDDPDEYDEDEDIYEYTVFRFMKKCYKTRMSDHLERHPEMEIILRINYSPNSMSLWNRIKTKLGKNKITYSGCNFNIADKYSENKLIKDIKDIHNERLETDDI